MKKAFFNRRVPLFGNTKVMCTAALLTALAVAIAAVCKTFTIGNSIRITFENLPIILSGYLFGPWVGLFTGLCSDLINTAVSSYGIAGINPIITLGAGSVGFAAGFCASLLSGRGTALRLSVSVASAHILGNMIIKSLGIYIYYSTPLPILAIRIPLYAVIGIIEFAAIRALLASKGVVRAIGAIRA